MIEQPGPWGRAGLRASRFPTELAAAVEQRALLAGIRVQAVRRPGRTAGDETRFWGLASARHGAEELRTGAWSSPDELLELPLDGSAGEPVDDQLFLVCAHGKHDPCCALRGRGAAVALHAVRPGRVWETSHLGGDRFAANVLVLPSGLLYGRVPASAATEFADAVDAGTVVPDLLRGRVGLPPAAQAAAALAHRRLGLSGVGEVRVLASSGFADGVATVRLRTAKGDFAVKVAADRVAADGLTCAATGAGFYLRYRATELVPA
jgi:hypothetical protein